MQRGRRRRHPSRGTSGACRGRPRPGGTRAPSWAMSAPCRLRGAPSPPPPPPPTPRALAADRREEKRGRACKIQERGWLFFPIRRAHLPRLTIPRESLRGGRGRKRCQGFACASLARYTRRTSSRNIYCSNAVQHTVYWTSRPLERESGAGTVVVTLSHSWPMTQCDIPGLCAP